MLLLPIGHESNTVRRLPWITFSLMFLCILAHLYTLILGKTNEEKAQKKALEIQNFMNSHSYLQIDEETRNSPWFQQYLSKSNGPVFISPNANENPEWEIKLEEMLQELKLLYEHDSLRRWGLTPANPQPYQLITYQFLHAGWLHLIFNLLFLYLFGPFIEDAWGRPLFAVFYLGSGIVSAMAFIMIYPHLTLPLVGASGAIAGVMGAFLLRFWKTRIDYVYLVFFFVIIRGRFSAPAWLMLPLWVLMETANALLSAYLTPGTSGGVAHWAHVGGFLFGFSIALAVRWNRYEEKHILPKVTPKPMFVNESFASHEKAQAALIEGYRDKAFTILVEGAAKSQENSEAAKDLWKLSLDLMRIDEALPTLIKTVEDAIHRQDWQTTLYFRQEFLERGIGFPIELGGKIAFASYHLEQNDHEALETLLKEINEELDPSTTSAENWRDAVELVLKSRARFKPQVLFQIMQKAMKAGDIPREKRSEWKNRWELLS